MRSTLASRTGTVPTVPQYHTVRMHGCVRTLFAHTSSSSFVVVVIVVLTLVGVARRPTSVGPESLDSREDRTFGSVI